MILQFDFGLGLFAAQTTGNEEKVEYYCRSPVFTDFTAKRHKTQKDGEGVMKNITEYYQESADEVQENSRDEEKLEHKV